MSASSLATFATSTDHLEGTGVIAALEGEIANLTGFRRVLSFSSASAALKAGYAALGLGPGDHVLMPALTAAETAAPLLHAGCTLVFVDLLPVSLTIDPGQVVRCLSSRTKAIVGVDLFGWPHDTSAIRAIADQHGLAYPADSAQAFQARIHRRAASHAADVVVLSLNAQKDLAAGEGGLLLTSNGEVYEHALRATQHPRRQARELGLGRVNHFPQNARLNPVAAALALEKLPVVLEQIEQRKARARQLIAFLNTTGLIEEIAIPNHIEPSFPCITATWRNTPRPIELLTQLHDAGHSVKLRDLPVRPIHHLARQQFPHQVLIPGPLVQTEDVADRSFCLEAI